MPFALLCTTTIDAQARAFDDACRRAGMTVRIVSDRSQALTDPWRDGAIAATFDQDASHVPPVLAALQGERPAAVLAVGNRPAWLAAHLALAFGFPSHTPDAVAAATDKLLTRGRLLAAGLPVPSFVSLPLHGDEGLDRLTRVRFPAVISPVSPSRGGRTTRVHSLTELLEARDRIAGAVGQHPRATAQAADGAAVLVEAYVPGREFELAGVLEHGALRVFALFEKPDVRADPLREDAIFVTPARLAPARQRVVAGHVARAALALGLHHGPLHATCRVDEDAIVVLEVVPRASDHLVARAIPVVAPDRTPCALEDALLAHALGRPLDRYGHQAVASGVLRVEAPASGRLREVQGLDEVREMPWVTAVEVRPASGGSMELVEEAARCPVAVFAQGAQPADVVATLRDASARLRLVADGVPPTWTA